MPIVPTSSPAPLQEPPEELKPWVAMAAAYLHAGSMLVEPPVLPPPPKEPKQ